MPDLVTHITLSHLIRRPFNRQQKSERTVPLWILFYLGVLLPDLLTRPWYILFPVTKDWTAPFHTPVGLLATTALLALFFEPALRKQAFIHLSAGAGIHLVLDGFQKQVNGGNWWLFPFTWKQVRYGIAWPETFLHLIPVWIGAVVAVEIVLAMRRKR